MKMNIDYITQDQLLEELKISKSTLRKWIIEHQFPYYKVRNKKFFKPHDVTTFMESRKTVIAE